MPLVCGLWPLSVTMAASTKAYVTCDGAMGLPANLLMFVVGYMVEKFAYAIRE